MLFDPNLKFPNKYQNHYYTNKTVYKINLLLGYRKIKKDIEILNVEYFDRTKLACEPSKCIVKDNNNLRVPHIGWNNIEILNHCSLFVDLENDYFYFSHNYHVSLLDKNLVLSVTNYDYDFFRSIL